MASSDGLSEFHGRSPPGHDDDWRIVEVSERFTSRDWVETCEVTGDKIPLDEPHVHVVGRQERTYYRPDFVHWFFRDERALEEWFEDE